MKKILILGGSGLVGKAIVNELSKNKQYQVYGTYFQNSTLLIKDRCFKFSIDDHDNISSIMNTLKPNVVISCLRGDFYKQLIVHKKVAEYLRETGGKLYFFSTTNVFDNDLSKPHYEDDITDSDTDYGKYKIECEEKISEILHDDACILRIPQVWGKDSPRMKNLINSLNNNKDIVVLPKLFLNTNTDVMIARQLCYIIENNLNGIFHLASEDVVNYKGFYIELITRMGYKNAMINENFEEEGYLVILPKRNSEFPQQLRITNKLVIDYLIS